MRVGLPFIVGGLIVGGWWWYDENHEARTCPYNLINQFRCERSERFSNPEYDATKKVIEAEIAAQKTHGVESVAVLFRDLRNGPSFRIDQGESFLAMSLYKLPIMIRYLKDAEGDPRVLDELVTVKIDAATVNQNLSAGETLVDGQSYSVRDLLEKMTRYSDNYSRAALVEHYHTKNPDYDIVLDTLKEVGILDAEESGDARLVSLGSTASIFRILYNASYLNLEQSQQALAWLAAADYDRGIAQPIPSTIVVANKFGLANEGDQKQLHDCGIVYYPRHPYIACVMTKGSSITELEESIAAISKIIYTEVDRRYGGK